ncbi:hypothetical protein D3C75_1378340 [compost metagenome]
MKELLEEKGIITDEEFLSKANMVIERDQDEMREKIVQSIIKHVDPDKQAED